MKALPEAGVQAVLFDLDGTLVDSAVDLYAALCIYCDQNGVGAPPYATVRAVASRGARAILRSAFGDDEENLSCRMPSYLDIYARLKSQHTRPFAGIESLLAKLENAAVIWGIVTNKPTFLARDVLKDMGWYQRSAALVCGDTLVQRKPHPAPVNLACEQIGVTPQQCLFVGDDRRDVEAGRAAGLYTVAAGWGYLGGENPAHWCADALCEHPYQLASMLGFEPVA